MGSVRTWSTVVAVGIVNLFGVVPAGYAAGDAAAGKARVGICKVCHGLDGNSPANSYWERYTTQDFQNMAKGQAKYSRNPVWPKLADQNEIYLAKQLLNYKTGVRTDHNLWEFAGELSKKDMEDIAAYFAAQKPKSEPVSTDPAAKLGEELFKKGKPGMKPCMKCHGLSGHGNEKVARIAGQHVAYIQKQIWAFKLAERKTTLEMPPVVEKLTETEIKAVAEYVTGLE